MRSSRMPPAPPLPMRGSRTWSITTTSPGTSRRPSAQPVPAATHREPAPVDRDAVRHAARVGVRQELDVGHVARVVEVDLQPPPGDGERAVGDPRGARIAVERGERPALGELREARRVRRGDGAHAPAEQRDRLGVVAARGERVQLRGVLGDLVVRAEGVAGVPAPAGRDEDPPAVGVGDDDVGATRGLRAQRRRASGRRRSAGRARAAARRSRPGRRCACAEPSTIVCGAARQHAHDPVRAHGVAAHLREPRDRGDRPLARRHGQQRPVGARGRSVALLRQRPPRRRRPNRRRCASGRRRRRGHDRADALAGRAAPAAGPAARALADERVGRPLQVVGAQVGERDDHALGDRAGRSAPAGSGRTSRPSGRRRTASPAAPSRGRSAAACDRGRARRRSTPRARA